MKEGQVPRNAMDLTDRKFSRLLVVERSGSNKHGSALWFCKCDCGGEATPTTSELRRGLVRSCGCLRRETAAQTAKTRVPRDKTDWSNRETKYCPDCRQELPASEFGRNSSAYDGLTNYCKTHHTERGRLNIAKNHGSGKAYRLRYRHGISIEQYEQMLIAQNHKCAICKEYPKDNLKNPWHVDHDHKTGKVRGVLCHSCNTALGNFNDSVEILRRALEYLTL